MMTRPSKKPMRRSSWTLLIAVSSFIAVAVGFTSRMRASDNLDFDIDGQIYDAVWDSRLFDGTPGFSGAILWFYNPSAMPGNITQASFEASIESSFDTWESVDNGLPEAPVVPVVSFGGQTAVTDPFALDGVNVVGWQPESPGGTLAVTPCWALDAPTTTTTDGTGRTVMPVDGGSAIPFPGPPGLTYPVGTIIDCGMRFDSLDAWSTADVPDPSRFDVQSVATHEGGHFIGVSHSTLGDFTAINPMSATMLPFGSPGDLTFRTLEEDDKASVLRVYARNRFSGPLPATVGGRAVINLRLMKDGTCVPATGVSVVAYRTQSGINGMNRVETYSGSQL
jgi:Matrixin